MRKTTLLALLVIGLLLPVYQATAQSNGSYCFAYMEMSPVEDFVGRANEGYLLVIYTPRNWTVTVSAVREGGLTDELPIDTSNGMGRDVILTQTALLDGPMRVSLYGDPLNAPVYFVDASDDDDHNIHLMVKSRSLLDEPQLIGVVINCI